MLTILSYFSICSGLAAVLMKSCWMQPSFTCN